MERPMALHCSVNNITPHFSQAQVIVPAAYVDIAFLEAATAQQQYLQTSGFQKGKTPISYITDNFAGHLSSHVQKFLYSYLVYPFLLRTLHEKKVLFASNPRIAAIDLKPGHPAIYDFELTLFSPLELKNWKHFPFKAPKRKNYKDIDRQVDDFMKEELDAQALHSDAAIAANDWVYFTICLVDATHKPLLDNYTESLWLKIGNEAGDQIFQEEFLGKKVNDQFFSDAECFQECFSDAIETKSKYSITIKDIIPYQYFSLDAFKRHFKIVTKKDLQKKLIEVFSYRNDLTQRRAMIEEMFKLLISKHNFEAPHYVILRQQDMILKTLQDNPDYQVYKTEKNFHEYVEKLAVKQTKEMLIIDQIAYEENIIAKEAEISDYLNFTKRNRMKEFLYFTPPDTKHNGQETPISSSILTHNCLREKTVNHIINQLTKK